MTSKPAFQFTAKQIARLREEYGFRDSYKLEETLDRVAMFFEKPEYYEPPEAIKIRRARFNKIQAYSEKLIKELKVLSDRDLLLIGRHSSWMRLEAIEAVRVMREIAYWALRDLKDSGKGGAPRKDTERRLIAKLRGIYKEGTGKLDWHFPDPYDEDPKYTGPLVEFIEEIAGLLNVQIKNGFIGDTLNHFPVKGKPT